MAALTGHGGVVSSSHAEPRVSTWGCLLLVTAMVMGEAVGHAQDAGFSAVAREAAANTPVQGDTKPPALRAALSPVDARRVERGQSELASRAEGRIVVNVEGFRNDVGDALFALFRGEHGFPKEPLRAERRVISAIKGGRTQLVFDDVKPGVYAISVLHDEDRNRKVKTGIFGIPREGVGFSRDAHAMFGPPAFKNAELKVSAAGTLTVSIRMHYY